MSYHKKMAVMVTEPEAETLYSIEAAEPAIIEPREATKLVVETDAAQPLAMEEAAPLPDESNLKTLKLRSLLLRSLERDAREHVCDLHSQLLEPPTNVTDKLREKHHEAVRELSEAHRAASLAQAKLISILRIWQRITLRLAN